MSVTASVFCLDCREFAPRIGDGGAVGFPSLANSPATKGGYQTFGYLRKGFDAIGYQPWELEAIAAFLKAHTRHEMSLYLEGEDVRYDAWEIEDEPNPVADVSDATEFVFDDDDFVNAFYAVACEKCGERVQFGPVRLRAGEPGVLTKPRIDKFLERVRKVDGHNFHRVSHLLDYYNDQEHLAGFLVKHKGHAPVAAIVDAESWTAAPDVKAWQLAWSRPEPLPYNREPLVVGDRIFVMDARAPFEERELNPSVSCVSMTGELLWRRELPTIPWQLRAWRDGVIAQCAMPDGERGNAFVYLDAASGEVRWSRQSPYRIFDMLGGEDAFVGCRSAFDDPEEDGLAIVELPTLDVRWEFVLAATPFDRFDVALATPDAVIAKHGSGHIPATVVCFSRSDGAIRWSTTVPDPKERRGPSGFFLWRDLLIMNAGPMVALRLADGAVAWTLEVPLEQWFASGDLVWGTQYAAFGAFDLQTRSMRSPGEGGGL